MTDNRIFSKDACTVCGRLGEPHTEWCADTRERLQREAEAYTEQLRVNGRLSQQFNPELRGNRSGGGT